MREEIRGESDYSCPVLNSDGSDIMTDRTIHTERKPGGSPKIDFVELLIDGYDDVRFAPFAGDDGGAEFGLEHAAFHRRF